MASGRPATARPDGAPRAGASSCRAFRHRRTSPLDLPVQIFPHERRRQDYRRRYSPLSCLCYAISKSFVKGISRVAKWGEKRLQAAARRGHNWLSTSGAGFACQLPPGCPRFCTGLPQGAAVARSPRCHPGTASGRPRPRGTMFALTLHRHVRGLILVKARHLLEQPRFCRSALSSLSWLLLRIAAELD